jgi:hypothetical protein
MKSPRARRSVALLAFAGAVFLALVTLSTSAEAYPWMIRHGYSTCTPCHADPTGSGLLTEYGRAQGELLLRTRYGKQKAGEEEEAGSVAGFMWGAIKPPEWLLLGVSVRDLLLVPFQNGKSQPVQNYLMQDDAKAQITIKRFRASGTLGFAKDGDLQAAITRNPQNNLIAREFWLGVDIGEDKNFLLRAGRLEVPFGIRQIEHTLFVRLATQTDIDATQQYGVAFSYSGEKIRGELMGIAGNYNVNPDDFRQRGYAGFLELTLGQRETVGVSSELTYAKIDPNTNAKNSIRSAHGGFTRLAPWKPLVLMAEVDALVDVQAGSLGTGYAAMLQLDFEPIQGVHLIGTAEGMKDPANTQLQWGGWGSLMWFFAPHCDVRVDFVDQLTPAGTGTVNTFSIGPQLHVYL